MTTGDMEIDRELQHVLWACYEYSQREPFPPEPRSVCYTWVRRAYEKRFGCRFHQSKLSRLAKLGFLELEETARAGHRRYYQLVDANQVRGLLEEWGLL